jgi:hypothetical protein
MIHSGSGYNSKRLCGPGGFFSVPYTVKAAIKNKKIKDHKHPDDSSNKTLILAFFLFTRVRYYKP